mgnify:CR=1 FL=1
MKKLTFVAAMAIAASACVSCGPGTPKASLRTDVDSLSYALGVQIADEFNQYNALTQTFGVDSAYLSEFVKGVNDAIRATDNKKQNAYMAGIQVANVIANRYIPGSNRQFFGDDSTHTISKETVAAAFLNIVLGRESAISSEEATAIQEGFQKKQLMVQYGDNKKQGEDFLAENAKNDSVLTTASGLQYKIIKAGTGAVPTDSSRVKVDYEGRLIDGTVFDSSIQRGEPTEFVANQVIKGWTEALTMMPVGSEWEVYIPQELAYGERTAGPTIKPFSALIFKIKLIDIVK